VAWAFLLLIIAVQSWWAMFRLRDHHPWTFLAFSVVLLQTILVYMLAGLVFPDFSGEHSIDLRTHYFAHTGWFFGLTILVLLVSLAKNVVLDGHLPGPGDLTFHLIFIAIAVPAALTRREWYHRWMPVLAFV